MEQLMEMPRTALLSRTVSTRTTPVHTFPVGSAARWFPVCKLGDLEDSWGEAALINGQQVALFRVGEHEVFAVSQADPATHSHVMARGVVGSRGDSYTIASPLHKEVYSLATGECFGRPELSLDTFPVRVVAGAIEVEL